MKSRVRFGLGLMALTTFAIVTACGDDDDSSPTPSAGSHAGGAKSDGGEPAAHAGEPAAHGGADGQGGAGHTEAPVICKVLGELCHEADSGEGASHECHELGHVGNVATCEQEFDGCIAICTHDEGAGGSGSGGAGPSIDSRCAALGELCHPVDDGGKGTECHEVGHKGNAAACAAEFEDCAAFCLEAREALEPEGEGGAPAGQGGAGGAAAAVGGAGGAG